jgi:hypothetical protein
MKFECIWMKFDYVRVKFAYVSVNVDDNWLCESKF